MKRTLREVIETIVLAVLIFLLLRTSVQNTRVVFGSMDPTLKEGQLLVINKAVYMRLNLEALANSLPFVSFGDREAVYPFHRPQRGDIIVFRAPPDPTRDFVKRIIGTPGDTVELRHGTVYVNGEPLSEPYVEFPSTDSFPRITVGVPSTYPGHWPERQNGYGPDEYFVLGDNRRASEDSRFFGTVPLESIIGKVWFTYWPLDSVQAYLAPIGLFR